MARIVYGVVGAALATLVSGFFIRDSTLPLLVSIGFSLVAAVLILVGWARRISLEDDVLFEEPVVWDLDEPVPKRAAAERTAEITAVSSTPPRTSAARTASKPKAARGPRPRAAAAAATVKSTTPAPTRSKKDVVVIPGRARYHTARCRFASNPAAETVKQSQAVARGFEPCSVCNPVG